MGVSRTLVSLSLVLLGVEAAVIRKEAHIGRVAGGHGEAKLASVAHHTGAAAVVVQGHKAAGGKIVPPLVDVDTDKKFFGPPFPADYPDDVQPPANKKIFSKTKVYPKVQDEGFFDKDFVKDENSDGGKWQAQQDYDAARTKIANKKRQAENAAKRAANEAKATDEAEKKLSQKQKNEDEANKVAQDAEGKEASERDAQQRARDKIVQKQKEHAAKVAQEVADSHETAEERQKAMENKVREAEKALTKQKKTYAECAKKLDEAKARVKALEAEEKGLKSENSDSSLTFLELSEFSDFNPFSPRGRGEGIEIREFRQLQEG